MKNNAAVASFHCLVCKIWKEKYFTLLKEEFVLFLTRKKTNITFLCRFVIKYSQIFFSKS